MKTKYLKRFIGIMLAATMIFCTGCGSEAAVGETDTAETDSGNNFDEGFPDVAPSIFDDYVRDSEIGFNEKGEGSSYYTYDVTFPEGKKLGYVRIIWDESPTAEYLIKYGDLGADTYSLAKKYEDSSILNELTLDFNDCKCGQVETDRIRVMSKESFSISKIEAYEENPWQQVFDNTVPVIEEVENSVRTLSWDNNGLDKLYEIYGDEFTNVSMGIAGCDYEEVVDLEGNVYCTINDKTIQLAPSYSYRGWTVEGPAIDIDVPAGIKLEQGSNECPVIIPEIQEWVGGDGVVSLNANTKIIVDGLDSDGSAMLVAAQLKDDYKAAFGTELEVPLSTDINNEDVTSSILLQIADDNVVSKYPFVEGVGDEGYVMVIDEGIRIYATTRTGLYYGTRTLLQMATKSKDIPCGVIRDYPTYEVRGFGIDVARKIVPLETLYKMAKELSWYKLNNFQIHLNDNAIMQNSGKTGSVEEAMTAYQAFRLESDQVGVKPLTAQDYYYTKEEFSKFIDDMGELGITVTPEFDTPAHSLAFTSTFPELGIRTGALTVEMLDLSKPETIATIEEIWDEYLDEGADGSKAIFEDCDVVHIGADEYCGYNDDYLTFVRDLTEYLKGKGKKVRMWGSLTRMNGSVKLDPNDVEMVIWSITWAKPVDMYNAGYDIINSVQDYLYIIPGGSRTYLDTKRVYEDFEVNEYPGGVVLPKYSERLLGSNYVMWNDFGDKPEIVVTLDDLYDGFVDAAPYFTQKCWKRDTTLTYDEMNDFIELIGTAP